MPEELAARRLRTFFVGTETSRNPLLPKLQDIGKRIVEGELCDGPAALSARYGKRVLITIGGSSVGALKDTDFVEIVDYDASKNRCLLMGKAEPSPDAGVHWLVYANREEVGSIVHIRDPVVLEVQEATRMFPETKEQKNPGNLELAVEALKLLRKGPYFVLRGHGCMAVGKHPEEALAIARQARDAALKVIEEAAAMGSEEGEVPEDEEPGLPPAPRRR
jgi:ribulose-5-phosphate 4-epimerase/fuculose-1-phosphate aldolase